MNWTFITWRFNDQCQCRIDWPSCFVWGNRKRWLTHSLAVNIFLFLSADSCLPKDRTFLSHSIVLPHFPLPFDSGSLPIRPPLRAISHETKTIKCDIETCFNYNFHTLLSWIDKIIYRYIRSFQWIKFKSYFIFLQPTIWRYISAFASIRQATPFCSLITKHNPATHFGFKEYYSISLPHLSASQQS